MCLDHLNLLRSCEWRPIINIGIFFLEIAGYSTLCALAMRHITIWVWHWRHPPQIIRNKLPRPGITAPIEAPISRINIGRSGASLVVAPFSYLKTPLEYDYIYDRPHNTIDRPPNPLHTTSYLPQSVRYYVSNFSCSRGYRDGCFRRDHFNDHHVSGIRPGDFQLGRQ